MTSAAPSPCLARAASRVEAGTPGATGQTLRRAGRFSPFSAPPCPGRPDQVAASSPSKLMAVFPVGAAFNTPPLAAPAGFSFDEAGMRC